MAESGGGGVGAGEVALVVEGDDDADADRSKPPPPGAEEKGEEEEAKTWLVTETGRLKMVHPGSSRTTAWTPAAGASAKESTVPIELHTVERECKDRCEATVQVNAEGKTGFSFEEASLRITHADEHVLAATTLSVGDVVTAVDGAPVQDFAEYARLTTGRSAFTVSFRPSEAGHSTVAAGDAATAVVAVEFDKAEVVCPETAGTIRVPVRRVGNIACRLEWRWTLANGTVVDSIFDGLRQEGRVIFESSVRNTYIEIDVPQDPTWNAEAVHVVHLDPRPAVVPADMTVMLGYNQSCSVYSLNMVSFPAGIYGFLDGEEKKPSLAQMVRGFLEHNYTEIRSETHWAIALSFVPPVLHYFKQLFFEVLVDCGIVPLADQEKCLVWSSVDISPLTRVTNVLLTVVIARVLITILEHVVSARFRMLRLGGKATMKLRANVFATYLQLSEVAREAFDEGDVAKVMDTETELAIKAIWLNAFELQKKTVALVVKMVLTIQSAASLPVESAMVLVAAIPAMLLSLWLVLHLRGRLQFQKHHLSFVHDENWAAFVTMCSACNPLIINYKRGWHFTHCFQDCHKSYNASSYSATAFESTTLWITQYLFTAVSAVCVIIAGGAAQQGYLSVGSFLVLISAVDGFGSDLHSIAGLINTMVIGSAAVKKLAEVLNSETRRLDRCCKEQESREAGDPLTYDGDIVLQAVRYRYATQEARGPSAVPLLNLMIPAGHMVCFPITSMVTDVNRPGIHTLFKVISGELLPLAGKVLIPSRWRCIYVPVVPILFDGTLMYNLSFSDRSKPRAVVWDVCRALGLSPYLIEHDDFDVGSDGCCLKFSDRVIISITRALMHDVDLLLISSALDVLGETRACKVLRYLRRYTQQRGLPQERLPRVVRHRKTVLYTSKFALLHEQATHEVTVPAQGEIEAGDCEEGCRPSAPAPSRVPLSGTGILSSK